MNRRQRKAAVTAKRHAQKAHCDLKRRAKAVARLRDLPRLPHPLDMFVSPKLSTHS